MIYLLILAAVAVAALGVLMARQADAFARERAGWVEERRELINRVQRPNVLPAPPVRQRQRTPQEIERDQQAAAALASVGTVTHLRPTDA